MKNEVFLHEKIYLYICQALYKRKCYRLFQNSILNTTTDTENLLIRAEDGEANTVWKQYAAYVSLDCHYKVDKECVIENRQRLGSQHIHVSVHPLGTLY